MSQGKFGGGNGTQVNPFLIEDAEDLFNIRKNLKAHYKLKYSINLGVYPYNQEKGWIPINGIFEGTLNGNGKKIFNLYINRPSEDYLGLFRDIRSPEFVNARIFDLGIENADITGRNYIGVLAGQFIASSPDTGNTIGVERCHFSGKIMGRSYLGGITGTARTTNTAGTAPWHFAEDCFVDVDVIPTENSVAYGGVAGSFNSVNATRGVRVTNVLSVGKFLSEINGTFQSGMDSWRFGKLEGTVTGFSNHAVNCWADSSKWIGNNSNGQSSETTENLLNLIVGNFDRRISKNGKNIWSIQAGKRYPMLSNSLSDRYFVKSEEDYYTYENGEWVVKFSRIPTREEAINKGMPSLSHIGFQAWLDFKNDHDSAEIINIVEKSNGTDARGISVSLDADAERSNNSKNIFRVEVDFSNIDGNLVQVEREMI